MDFKILEAQRHIIEDPSNVPPFWEYDTSHIKTLQQRDSIKFLVPHSLGTTQLLKQFTFTEDAVQQLEQIYHNGKRFKANKGQNDKTFLKILRDTRAIPLSLITNPDGAEYDLEDTRNYNLFLPIQEVVRLAGLQEEEEDPVLRLGNVSDSELLGAITSLERQTQVLVERKAEEVKTKIEDVAESSKLVNAIGNISDEVKSQQRFLRAILTDDQQPGLPSGLEAQSLIQQVALAAGSEVGKKVVEKVGETIADTILPSNEVTKDVVKSAAADIIVAIDKNRNFREYHITQGIKPMVNIVGEFKKLVDDRYEKLSEKILEIDSHLSNIDISLDTPTRDLPTEEEEHEDYKVRPPLAKQETLRDLHSTTKDALALLQEFASLRESNCDEEPTTEARKTALPLATELTSHKICCQLILMRADIQAVERSVAELCILMRELVQCLKIRPIIPITCLSTCV